MSLSKIFIRPITFRATDDSTSSTSLSSVAIFGGLSVRMNTNIGANLGVTGKISILDTTDATSLTEASFVTSGGASFGKSVVIGGELDLTSGIIKNVSTPSSPTDAANKKYVDDSLGNPLQTQITSVGILTGLTSSADVVITATTGSTSITTGALSVKGGISSEGDIYGGRVIIQPGNSLLFKRSDGNSTAISIGADPITATTFNINNASASGTTKISATNVILDGTTVLLAGTTDSSSISSGALQVLGGVGIAKRLYVGGQCTISSFLNVGNGPTIRFARVDGNITSISIGADSTNNSQFNIINNSGAGSIYLTTTNIVLNAFGNVSVPNTTDSTSITSGSVQIAGGLGVAKSLYVGGSLVPSGNVNIAYGMFLRFTRSDGGVGQLSMGADTTGGNNNLALNNGSGHGSISLNANTGSQSKIYLNSETTLVQGTVDSTSLTSGSLQVSGGLSVTKSLFVGTGITLASATSNLIYFTTAGSAIPQFTTRSLGTKIVVYPNISASTVDYAVGIESLNMWFSTPSSTTGFKWYAGTTVAMQLTGTGSLTITNSTTASTQSITALQPNLSTGSYTELAIGVAYSSNNVGVIDFNYTATGSASNSLGFGLYGANNLVFLNRNQFNSTLPFYVNNATDATTVSTGSFITTGGASILKTLYVGNSTVGSTVTPLVVTGNGTTTVQITLSNTAVTNGLYNLGVGNTGIFNLYSGLTQNNVFTVSPTSVITFTQTSDTAVSISGGLSISKILNVTGLSTTSSISMNDGSTLAFGNGLTGTNRFVKSSGQDLRYVIGGSFRIRDTTDVSDLFTFNSSGTFSTTNTTDATGVTSSTSPFFVAGGAAVAKTLYLGGSLKTNVGSGAIQVASVTNNTESSMYFYRYTNYSATVAGDQWILGQNVGSAGAGYFSLWTTVLGNVFTFDTAGRGTFSNAATFSSGISLNNNKITGVADPTISSDVATKNYVDFVAQGLDLKNSVSVSTTAAGILSTSFAAGQMIDGVTLIAGKRILIKDQVTLTENGIYVVNATGTPTRAVDMATGATVNGAYTFVENGTSNKGLGYVVVVPEGQDVVGTNDIIFTQFSGAGQITAGTGLSKSANTLSVNASQTQITSVGTLTGLTTSGNIILPLGDTLRFARIDGGTAQHMIGSDTTTNAQFNIKNLSGGGIVSIQTVSNGQIILNTNTLHFLGTNDATSATIAAFRISGGVGIQKNLMVANGIGMGGVGELRIDYPNISGGRLLLNNNGDLTIGRGTVSITNTTASTSSTTGSLIVAGGMGITGSIFIGGNLFVTGTSSFTGIVTVPTPTNTTDATTKAYVDSATYITAGTGLSKSGAILSVNTTQTQITSLGTLTGLISSGVLSVTNTTDSTSTTTGSVQVAGGVSVVKNLYVGGNLTLSTSASTSVQWSNGAVLGYVSSVSNFSLDSIIGDIVLRTTSSGTSTGNIRIGTSSGISTLTVQSDGNVIVKTTTDSTSINSGAFQVFGGVGVAKALTVGTTATITSDLIVGDNIRRSLNTSGITISGGTSKTNGGWIELYGTSSNSGSTVVGTRGILYLRSYDGTTTYQGLTMSNIGNITLNQTTDSTSSTSGTLVVLGGVGIGKNLYVGGGINSIQTHASGTTVDQFVTKFDNNWGMRLVQNFAGSNDIYYQWYNTYSPSSPVERLWLTVRNDTTILSSHIVSISSKTDSISSTSGALQVAGGLGIVKNVFIGGNLAITGTSTFTGTVTVPTPSNGTDPTTKSYVDGATYITAGAGLTKTDGTLSINSSQPTITSLGTLSSLNMSAPLNITTAINSQINITSNLAAAPATFSHACNYFKPLMGANEAYVMGIGGLNSAKNAGYIGFNFVASGSDLNYMTIGVHSVDKVFRVYSTGSVMISTTTDTSSTTTGALQVAGGASVVKNLYVGGNIVLSTSAATSVRWSNGAALGYVFSGGDFVSGALAGDLVLRTTSSGTPTGNIRIGTSSGTSTLNVQSDGNVIINTTTDSTSTITGAFQVSGGVGITKSLSIGGSEFNFSNSAAVRMKMNTTNNIFWIGANNADPAGDVHIYDATVGTRILGWYRSSNILGLGYTNGTSIVQVTGTTDSSSSTTGSLQVSGGVAIAKTLYMSGQILGKCANPQLRITNVISGNESSIQFSSTNDYTSTSGANWYLGQNVGGIGAGMFSLFSAGSGSIGNVISFAADGTIKFFSTTDSTSVASGALQITGGVSISKNLTISSLGADTITTNMYPSVLPLTGNSTNISTGSYGNGTYTTSASSIFSTAWDAYLGFANNNTGNPWSSVGGGYNTTTGAYLLTASTTDVTGTVYPGEWLQIMFPLSRLVRTFTIIPRSANAGSSPTTFVLFGSNNGTTWNVIFRQTSVITWVNNVPQTFTTTSGDIFSYFRIVVTTTGGNNGNAQFYMNFTTSNAGMQIQSTLDSTSSTSGALQVLGGVGIAKRLYVGGQITLASFVNIVNGQMLRFTRSDGSIGPISMGADVTGGNNGQFIITNSSGHGVVSINTNSGSQSKINLNTETTLVLGTIDSTSSTSGALTVSGGLGVSKNVNVGGMMTVADLIVNSSNEMLLGRTNSTYLFIQTIAQNKVRIGAYDLTITGYRPISFESQVEISSNIIMKSANTVIQFDSQTNTGIQWAGGSSKIYEDGQLNITTDDNLYLRVGGTNRLRLTNTDESYFTCHLIPTSGSYYNLGNATYRVGTLTVVNINYSGGLAGPSDSKLKTDIKEISLGLEFINNLKPVSYKWKDENWNQRKRLGLIAQDVKTALQNAEENVDDIEMIGEDNDGYLTMSYIELISPIIKAIQELKTVTNRLQEQIDNLF